jgi:hypothetical protein
MVSRTGSNSFTLYAANSIYNGDDGSTIGFIASSSIAGVDLTDWVTSNDSYFGANGNSITISGKTYTTFSGSYQEIRYYTVGLSSSAFQDYTMNPDSIEGNYLNSSPDQLAFRASLGGELFTGSASIHPKATGAWTITSSFGIPDDNDFGINGGIFTPNVETVYLDQPAAGIKNIVSNKIQVVDMDLPAGNTLSQYRSIQQKGSGSYTENLAYTEVAFSPQNEINDDIMDQLGFFNMGEFIGDPRQRFNQDTSYPDLDALRNAYFEKYKSNYNLNDYIRLIKFFDNSLFKMIKDFTPARSSLASGVVIKQTLLERNKYPQPEVTQSLNDLSGSIPMGYIDGGAGGSVNNLNGLDTNPYYVNNVYGVTQSWQENIIIPSGIVTQTHSSQDEFYNGEYSGSEFIVEDGELNTSCDIYKNPSTQDILYNVSGNFLPSFQQFVNQQEFVQGPGEIHIWWGQTTVNRKDYSPGYVDYVYSPTALTISKISANGINLEDYIPNALEYIFQTAYVSGDVTLSGWTPSFFPSYNLGNLDLKVDNIQEVYASFSGTGYYIVQLVPNSYNITVLTDQAAGTVTIANKSNVTSILEPYVPIGFYNSTCNPLINNSEVNRLSQWQYQVDYNTAQTVPVNFAQIISGTAYPAALQDSNYTSYQYSGIRYWGSKNTTDGFNTSSISQSLIVGSYQNDNIGATTLGYPSVDKLDATILQFDWGGGTYPQIINGGILALNDMLLVGANRDAIGKYSPQQKDYLTATAQAYPIGSYPIFNQYTTAVTTTVGAEVAEYGWTTPSVSNYYIPSGSSAGLLFGGALITSSNPNELYIIDTTADFLGSPFISPPGLGSINSQGFEVPTRQTGSLNTYKTISSSLAEGGEWYVSMYINLGSMASGALQPITGSSKLSQQGVYKIISIDKGPGISTLLTASLETSINTAFSSSVFGAGAILSPTGNTQNAGLLIWQSVQGNYMRVKNATLSGLGKGGLVTSTPTPVIETEFTYITQEYGTNPKNQ